MRIASNKNASWEAFFEREKYDRYADAIKLARKISTPEHFDIVASITAEAYLAGCVKAERLYLLNSLDESHAFAVLDRDDELEKFLDALDTARYVDAHTE